MNNEHSVTLSVESVTLHEKWELVSVDNVDLCMKSKIWYPWIMFTYTKKIIFCEQASQLYMKNEKHYT